jgi:hypothetical protein
MAIARSALALSCLSELKLSLTAKPLESLPLAGIKIVRLSFISAMPQANDHIEKKPKIHVVFNNEIIYQHLLYEFAIAQSVA